MSDILNSTDSNDVREDNEEDSDSSTYCKCENAFDKIKPKFTLTANCATWAFLTGVERAIILPTLWLYLVTRFGSASASTYYGVTLAAFNLGGFIFTTIFGYLAYKGFKTKALLVISNQMEVVGNIIYFAASEPWLVMLGRFIAGVGSGSEVPLYADVVRVTSTEERTSYIVILLLARQVGLILGPAAALILHPMTFQIGGVSLNVYNSPGFLMAILWCLQTIQVLVSYPDVSKTGKTTRMVQEKKCIHKAIIKTIYERNNESESSTDEQSLVLNDTVNTSGKRISKKKVDGMISKLAKITNYATMSLLMIIFSSYFCLIGLEAVLPPVTVRYLKWTEVENSCIYIVAGVMVIIIFIILQKVAQFVKDRTILLVGLISLIISYFMTTVILLLINSDQKILYTVLLCIGLFFHILGLSLVSACAESLFSKTIPPEDMDIAQSILRTTMNFSFLFGPFIAGSLQMYSYIVFIIFLLLSTYSLLFLISRYSLFEI